MVYDVVVIGSGVIGALVARSLSFYNSSVLVLEKEADVAMGTTKANSAIVHAGYDAKFGSFKARFNVKGNVTMQKVTKELDVPFKRIGSLVLGFKDEDKERIQELYDNGVKNGIKGLEILNGEEVRKLEPNLSKKVKWALLASTAGIVCPYELSIGAMENAVENGVDLMLSQEVLEIKKTDDLFHIVTKDKEIVSKTIVNAAGLQADKISHMAGDDSFYIGARKGEYLLLDKTQGSTVNHVIFQLPSDAGKGILVTPTVDGNLLLGPNAQDIDDKDDLSTTPEGLEQVVEGALKAVPGVNLRDVITSFSGLRARPSTGDFVIGESKKIKNFINVAGIESPGLSAAPAIAEYVVDLLKEAGLDLIQKGSFNSKREAIKRFVDIPQEELNDYIKDNKAYGKMVCRCEKVTEAEIIASIKRPAGATNLDAVKRRTRAGMGRCSGGFCTPKVVEVLARELDVSIHDVTKLGEGSNILTNRENEE